LYTGKFFLVKKSQEFWAPRKFFEGGLDRKSEIVRGDGEKISGSCWGWVMRISLGGGGRNLGGSILKKSFHSKGISLRGGTNSQLTRNLKKKSM